ncbi:3-deoxy-D-manno-octulosonic acid transferase [Minwuia sp.]|uniref:3-deoxy-D-manno-octulosonic acid transferase n=1 Tax=Minwuia sp. TaxID=2493630 RepID=UPI003A942E99
MILPAYRLLSRGLAPVGAHVLKRRMRNGKEDPQRAGERMGHASVARPDGPLVWFHVASVGEAQSVLSLIDRIVARRPDLNLLVTSGTVTSAALLSERLPERAVHQFVPIDLAAATRRFIAHWKPDLAIWIESELWPNLIDAMAMTGKPLALINGRMSERSFGRWRFIPGAARAILKPFSLILAQSEEAAARFRGLGADNVRAEGNLKYAAELLPVDTDAVARLTEAIADRPCWISASIHPGEDQITGSTHLALQDRFPGLLTIMIPRHPARAKEMSAKLEARGIAVMQRSQGDLPGHDTGVYIADTMGELGLFYSLAAPVFVGGSLVPHGGQNVLEPARFGRCVLTGPHTENFADVMTDMRRDDAVIEVENGDELSAAIGRLLSHRDECVTLGNRARGVANRQSAVLDRVLARLEPLMPRP